MLGGIGLICQSAAGPLGGPAGPAAQDMSGRPKAFTLACSAGSLNTTSYNATIQTPAVTITPTFNRKRGQRLTYSWRQISGPAGVPAAPTSASTYFTHTTPAVGSYPVVWRAIARNQYGISETVDVHFAITREDFPQPDPLVGVGSPSFQRVDLGPGVYSVEVFFSVTASGGAGGYTYNWGGGTSPFTASNSTIVTFAPNSGGTTFAPGCAITDAASNSIVVGGILFVIVEYGH